MRYIIRRLAQAVITIVSGLFITFSLYRLMPGGPVEAIMADLAQDMRDGQGGVNQERLEQRAELLTGINPDQPIPVAFYDYVFDIVVNQEFGRSILYQRPVFDMLFEAFPWSLFISLYGLMLGFVAVVLIGVIMAWYEGTKVDSGLTVFILSMNAIPYYVGAIVMLTFLAFQWELFPSGGRAPPGVSAGFTIEYMTGILYHAALPIATNFILGFAAGALGMRANTVRIVGSDYLRSARLRGLSTNRILTRYLTRNAILPIYTSYMLGISYIFSSNVVTEQLFQYRGAGWLLLDAATNQDYPLIMGSFLWFAIITIAAIMFMDLTYGLIDPRAETGGTRESY